MVATQLLRFHGELPSLRFEGWRSSVATGATTATAVTTSLSPLSDQTATSQHLIITRSRPLSSVCPSPVYARLSKHVSGLWRWSLYRLVRGGEEPEEEPRYDPQGVRAPSGLTLEAEARIQELKRVLKLPEDRPPVLALLEEQDVPAMLDEEGRELDVESVLSHDLESVLEHVSERYLGAPFEESTGRAVEIVEDESNLVDGLQVSNEGTPKTPNTSLAREITPRTSSTRRSVFERVPVKNASPDTPTKTSASKTPDTSTRTPTKTSQIASSATPSPSTPTNRVSALGMTPVNIPKTPVKLKESPVLRVPSPTELSPLSDQKSPTVPGMRSQEVQTDPSTPPSNLRDSLKSTPQKNVSTPQSARSVPTTPHKSLPSPPSSPLAVNGEMEHEEELEGANPSTPKQGPMPLPMSPGRDVLSPGQPLTPGTNTGTDATPLSPRTPLSPLPAVHQLVKRSESHSELLEHVERFKSGSIRSLEAIQAGLGPHDQQTSEQQESELARVFKRIRGRQAAIS